MATLAIQVSRDWETAVVTMRGHWGSDRVREMREALEQAGYRAKRPADTYYSRQSWYGRYDDLRSVVTHSATGARIRPVQVEVTSERDGDMTVEDVLEDLAAE